METNEQAQEQEQEQAEEIQRTFFQIYSPLMISLFILLTGIFFLLVSFMENPILEVSPPGQFYLVAIAGIFVCLGIYYSVLWNRGGLRRKGKSVEEIRKEAVENLNDPQLLQKIALEEENEEIQEIAKKRLDDMARK